ncbi:MAG: DUF11 domain-containing protein, partial [Xanthomonadales bacterium]|nr:DUF11 domain-containing protein [Xanthomonadales bacterium]
MLLLGAGSAAAEGTRTLHPATGTGSTGNRGVMDLTTTNAAGVARQRQFTYVYAREGEVILLGSRNRTTNSGSNRGQIRLWAPQDFGTKGIETDPSNASAVLTCDGSPGAGSGGLIASRAAELAGPNSADGSNTVPNGFTPCWYQVPAGGTGIYGVRFYGASSGSTNNASIPSPAAHESTVQAWDVTVRSGMSSLADINGRVFTYAWAIYLNANGRYLRNNLYYVSADGYRYRQTMQGLDPNRAVFYANPGGFIDGGAPLYKDVRGSNQNVNSGTSFNAGVTADRPAYPIFFSDVSPAGPNAAEVNRVLTALAIPQLPKQPILTVPTFVGNVGGHTSTVSSGGVFTFTTQNTLTYEIVVSRGAVGAGVDPNHPAGCVNDYDPANVCNRTLTGVALTGNHSVLWNGQDNDGFPFPAGSYSFQIVGRNGEIHFPMIDLEGNVDGGPTLTKLNAFNTTEATTVYFDDRGHRTSNGTLIGQLNGHLCGAGNAQVQPAPNHSLVGVDSADDNWNGSGKYYRSFTGSSDNNSDCRNSSAEYFGTAKGLDVWALERSPVFVEPVVIVEPSVSVDVGTMVSVTPAVLPGDSAYGSFMFTNAGSGTATGVTYAMTLGNPAVPATCPAAVTFSMLPAGVTATYHPAPACNVTFAGMPTSLTAGQSLAFNFNYVVAASNPGPIPVTTTIGATNETPGAPAPNTAAAQTVVAKPVISVAKSADPADGSSVVIGDTITYTVAVTIQSAPLTAQFTLTDTLGPGLTFGGVASSSPGLACSGSLTCTLPTGTATGTYSVSYTATVNNAAGSSVANQVTATGGGGTNPPTCDPCSTSHPIPSPHLTIDKTGPASAAIGVPFDYTITVTNTGTGNATANTTVTDVIPAGLTINSCIPSCSASGQTVTWTVSPSSLLAGGFVTLIVNVTPTTAAVPSVTNTATVDGGGDPACPIGTPCSSPPVVTPITWTAGIDLVKTVTSTGPYGLGSTITYSLVATNTGTAPLSNVSISDPLLGALSCTPTAPATLAPLATMTCTGSHVVTLADVNAGRVDNTASTSGTDPANNPVSATDGTSTPIAQNPALTLTKSVTSAGPYALGDTITYSFSVQNSGDTTLTGVAVNDPLLGGTIACTPATLAPGATASCGPVNYTVTAADVQAGHVANTATASGTPPATPGNPTPGPIDSPPDTTDTPITQAPGLTLTKSVTSAGPYALGDTITYSFSVRNSGDVTLTGVSVNDPLLGGTIACTPATLAPGATATCGPVNYTVTAADVNAGNVHNSAIASGTPPATPGNPNPPPVESPPDTTDTPITQAPGLTLTKSVTSTGPYALGDTITYSFSVQNSGDVTLTGVSVNDPLLGGTITCSPATLAPGASATCGPVNYTVTAADVQAGHVANTATASGTPPTVPGNPPPGPIDSPPDSTDTPIAQNPALTLEKSVTSTGPYGVGDTITYSFSVENTGDVTLTGVSVNDPLLGGTIACAPATLAPGASATCGPVNYTVTAADVQAGHVANTATASGTPPTVPGNPPPGPIDSPPDSTDTPIAQNPALTLEKSVTSTGPYGVGDTITYSFSVENTGDVTLTGVSVNDPLLGG